jgi:MFS transporter, PPP family, 3-phenylpropionic acid transporter
MNPKSSQLWHISSLQFFNYAARGFIFPFMGLYLVSAGFDGGQIGLLASASALAKLIVVPAIHTWVDRHGLHRKLYAAFLLVNALAVFGLIASGVPLLIGVAYVLRETVDMSGAALLSQLSISWLNQRNRDIYGRVRAWGSLGWSATTLVVGRVFALGGYPLLFLFGGLTNLASLIFVPALPERTAENHEQTSAAIPRPAGFYILMGSIFLFYLGMNAFMLFIFIYLENDLGASKDLIGVTTSLGALAEIPAMLLIDRLLRRLDIRSALAAGTVGMALGWIVFVPLQDATLIIPLMVLRGIFFSLYNISITLMVSQISHPTNAATNQALAQVTIPALALLLAGKISGDIFDVYGARVLFQIATLMGILSVVVLIAGWRHLERRNVAIGDAVGATS